MKTLTINVKNIQVLTYSDLSRPDKVLINLLDLPEAIYPFDRSTLHFSFQAAMGTGVEYVRKHFGIEPEVRKI